MRWINRFYGKLCAVVGFVLALQCLFYFKGGNLDHDGHERLHPKPATLAYTLSVCPEEKFTAITKDGENIETYYTHHAPTSWWTRVCFRNCHQKFVVRSKLLSSDSGLINPDLVANEVCDYSFDADRHTLNANGYAGFVRHYPNRKAYGSDEV
nr:NS9 protein [Bottlenose dolphin coronavirus]QII89057.1 NS9 protein [Bottlenose dolphin coronavirus]QII89071.1 NS9 protein [Bottlenose dolphin coronavirus]